MRIVFAALCSCLFALAIVATPAQAGDYGIGVHGPGYVWYDSGCCYRRLVPHQPAVIYYRAGALPDGPAYVVVYPQPPIYARVVEPYRRVRLSEFDYYSRYGAYGHIGCYWKGVPVHVWRGGWVWGRRTTCY